MLFSSNPQSRKKRFISPYIVSSCQLEFPREHPVRCFYLVICLRVLFVQRLPTVFSCMTLDLVALETGELAFSACVAHVFFFCLITAMGFSLRGSLHVLISSSYTLALLPSTTLVDRFYSSPSKYTLQHPGHLRTQYASPLSSEKHHKEGAVLPMREGRLQSSRLK